MFNATDSLADNWMAVVRSWPYEDERTLFTALGWAGMLLGYWVPTLALLMVYKFNLFASYKINPADKSPPSELVKETVVKNVFGSLLFWPLAMYFALSKICEGNVFTEMPSLWTFVWQHVVIWVLNDAWFYWTHRLAHDKNGEGRGLGSPGFYQTVHKKHHKYVWTQGQAAVYATELEDVIVNFPSTFLPPLVLSYYAPVHVLVFATYVLIRMEETVEGHSGYRMPLSPWHLLRSNDFHAYHHRYFNRGNFGIFTWWDSMCGTDAAYRRDRKKEGRTFWE